MSKFNEPEYIVNLRNRLWNSCFKWYLTISYFGSNYGSNFGIYYHDK